MCGRSSLTKTEKEIEKRFQATFYSEELERYNPLPNYNVAPTHFHPVITKKDHQHLRLFKWGLVPSWAKEAKIGFSMINARAETLLEKPVFRQILNQNRCLVPLDGFYEWKNLDGEKIPFRIQTKDQEIFSVAGLWDEWKGPDGKVVFTFTIITVEANDFMKTLHDRMPAILLREEEKLWIDAELPTHQALALLKPYPSEKTTAYKVDKAVNNVRNNYKELIEPID